MIDEWYSSKKTYHKCWELKEGGYAWVLFLLGDGLTGSYHTGRENTKEECVAQIKWCIGTELKKRDLI